MRPAPIQTLAGSRAVQPGQVPSRRRPDAELLHQVGYKFLVSLIRVPTHDAAQHCIGFQRRGMGSDNFPFKQSGLSHPLQHAAKRFIVVLDVGQPSS